METLHSSDLCLSHTITSLRQNYVKLSAKRLHQWMHTLPLNCWYILKQDLVIQTEIGLLLTNPIKVMKMFDRHNLSRLYSTIIMFISLEQTHIKKFLLR